MPAMKYVLGLISLILVLPSSNNLATAQDTIWQLQESNSKASLRGLCVVSDQIVWASGSGGTVLRTTDGGKNWKNVSAAGAEKLDFRDIHAFNDRRAVIINAGQPARFYLTTDGGETWKQTFRHKHKKSFFDAVSFWDDQHGIAMSDPVDDRVLLVETTNGGKSWKELPAERRPEKKRGEAGFAASGTNMRVVGKDTVIIGLGGAEEEQQEKTSRVVISSDRAKTWKSYEVPMPRNMSSGIFSIAFAGEKLGIAVGGNYVEQEITPGNMALTTDGGKTWKRTSGKPTSGYRSGVAFGKNRIGKRVVVAVGPTGTDVSIDDGKTFGNVSKEGFHAVQFTPDRKHGWASGADGRIAKWLGQQ